MHNALRSVSGTKSAIGDHQATTTILKQPIADSGQKTLLTNAWPNVPINEDDDQERISVAYPSRGGADL
jgi:hypothetical protein